MEIKKTRNMVFYLSIVVLLISVGFSVSYAYLFATVTGNDSAVDSIIRSGNVDVKFDNSSVINSASGKILLINDSDRATKSLKSSFTVSTSSKSTLNARYDIYLTDITISNNLKSGDLKWELLKNGVVLTSISNFNNVVSGEDFKLNNSVQSLTRGGVDTYELRIWLSKNDTDQTSLLTGSQFKAKIKVKATPVKAS